MPLMWVYCVGNKLLCMFSIICRVNIFDFHSEQRFCVLSNHSGCIQPQIKLFCGKSVERLNEVFDICLFLLQKCISISKKSFQVI